MCLPLFRCASTRMPTLSAPVRSLARCLCVLGLTLSGPHGVAAPYPDYSGPVVDQARVLSTRTRDQLAALLRDHRGLYGDEVAVATIPQLDGVRIEHYSIGLADHWRLGDAGLDNGVLILLALQERGVRIEIGSGLESSFSDQQARNIIQSAFLPRFRVDDIDGGIDDGVRAVLKHLQEPGANSGNSGLSGHSMLIPLLFLGLFGATHFLGRRRRKQVIETIVATGVTAMLAHSIGGQWSIGALAGIIVGAIVFSRSQRIRESQATSNNAAAAQDEPAGGAEPTSRGDSDPQNHSRNHRDTSRDSRRHRGGGDSEGGGFGGGGASGKW